MKYLSIVIIALLFGCTKQPIIPDITINPSSAEAGTPGQAKIKQDRRSAPVKTPEDAKPDYQLQPVYFDFDDSRLTSDARDVAMRNCEYLMQNRDGILIEGYCDERGSTEYNLALGERRAARIAEFYRAYGIETWRIRVVSYGEEYAHHDSRYWDTDRKAVTR